MIYLYSGSPGSGKSLHQARDIRNWLQVGKPVIANYRIDQSRIRRSCHKKLNFVYCDNSELSPEFLVRFSGEWFKNHKFREGAIRCYIDEAQLLFNCRSWDARNRAAWISFFTQHRKYGYDIFLIAQFDRMLDRQLRSLLEYEIIHRKLSNFGLRGKILSFVMGGGMFVAVKIWYPLKEKVGSEFFRYNRRLAAMYDSYALFEDGDAERGHKPSRVAAAPDRVRPAGVLAGSQNKNASLDKSSAGTLDKQQLIARLAHVLSLIHA